MKPNSFFYSLCVLALLCFVACGEPEKPKVKIDERVRESMIERNKEWAYNEKQVINNYIRRKKWDVITTGTGLRYLVYHQGDTTQPTAQDNDLVTVNYSVYLLESDSVCYSSNGVPETFRVAMDNVESGLHEAVTYLRKGDKAKIILPSYLAFGLLGDMDKIPPQSPLIYDLEIIKIIKSQP